MIHNIVFDIGEVLVDFNWKQYIEGLGFEKEITERLKKATVLNSAWNEQDRGNYNVEDLIQLHTEQDRGLKNEIRIFFENIVGIVKERAYAAPLLKYLKESGYGVYILSNYGKYAFGLAKKTYKFLEHIDGSLISYQVQFIKPDERIYQCFIEKYELEPEKCIFIDDRNDNVEAAETQGFHGIHFKSIEQVLANMQVLGIDLSGFQL